MISAQRWSAWGDRLNPMLVRVVRQELRSKAFVSIYSILLVGAVIASLFFAVMARNEQRDLGPMFFRLVAAGWSFALFVVQPTACFRAIANERTDDTWDLVELTGLGPLRVVGGLMTAALVQGLLYTSALAPFMVMAYLLRGLDLGTVLLVLLLIPMGGAAACALAVFTASLSSHKAVRTTLGGILGLGLLLFWFINLLSWLVHDALGSSFGSFLSVAFWVNLGAWINGWLAATTLLLVLAGSLISHRAADRSTHPRLVWWLLWGNMLLWFFVPLWFGMGYSFDDCLTALVLFSLLGCIGAGILGAFAVAEDVALSPRQARAISDPPRWRRYLTWLLGPGSARGSLSWLSMAAASLTIGAVAWGTKNFEPDQHGLPMRSVFCTAWAITVWTAILITLADRVARTWCESWFDSPGLRRGFTLLVTALACLIPPLVCALTFDGWQESICVFLSPITTCIRLYDRDGMDGMWGPFTVFSLFGVVAVIYQLRQGLRLGITLQRIRARADDHNPRG